MVFGLLMIALPAAYFFLHRTRELADIEAPLGQEAHEEEEEHIGVR